MENKKKRQLVRWFLLGVTVVCLFFLGQTYYRALEQRKQQEELLLLKENAAGQEKMTAEVMAEPDRQEEGLTEDGEPEHEKDAKTAEVQAEDEKTEPEPVMLEQYKELYEKNNDLAGWLAIEGTVIDYPVMQCWDNEYYLHHDFYGEESKYGCLYVKAEADLAEGTNFIIYGHNMKNGSMFGDLDYYKKKSFYEEHPLISFDTLYEERSYEIIAVFLSQVYRQDEDVFKYYQFYQADSEEEFDTFYQNIKQLALYDTGVEAAYGDTFLTLSTCAYHVQDGRLVVVAKRLKGNEPRQKETEEEKGISSEENTRKE